VLHYAFMEHLLFIFDKIVKLALEGITRGHVNQLRVRCLNILHDVQTPEIMIDIVQAWCIRRLIRTVMHGGKKRRIKDRNLLGQISFPRNRVLPFLACEPLVSIDLGITSTTILVVFIFTFMLFLTRFYFFPSIFCFWGFPWLLSPFATSMIWPRLESSKMEKYLDQRTHFQLWELMTFGCWWWWWDCDLHGWDSAIFYLIEL
jgi:hypothetical protein